MCKHLYSPFLQCSFPEFHDSQLCIYHLHNLRKQDDCPICFDSLDVPTTEVYMLSCGHLFHTKCLQHCKQPLCPMCRKQMQPIEAVEVFSTTVINPLMMRLYCLPSKSVEYVLRIIETTMDIASYGETMIKALWHGVRYFFREISM
jgi:RING-like zinc finger